MATESDVDIRSAHPYWAYPYNDIAVVHNGQLTNYWGFRREMERRNHRFMSNCDSELIAVYIADRLDRGDELEEAMTRSVDELDGVFTYVVATKDKLGMAKDVMAAKPMVLYESDEFVALASEEVAIRSVFPHEIDTYDPFEGEVKGLPEENLQSRLRGNILMSLANKNNAIVLTTGNKSEMATGYATLYGDLAGGFAVIKDVPKTLVYKLAKWRNLEDSNPLILHPKQYHP